MRSSSKYSGVGCAATGIAWQLILSELGSTGWEVNHIRLRTSDARYLTLMAWLLYPWKGWGLARQGWARLDVQDNWPRLDWPPNLDGSQRKISGGLSIKLLSDSTANHSVWSRSVQRDRKNQSLQTWWSDTQGKGTNTTTAWLEPLWPWAKMARCQQWPDVI